MPDKPQPYAVTLALVPAPTPGWRVFITPGGPEGGELVTIAQAEDIARAFTEVTNAEADTTPFMIVRTGTQVFRKTLEDTLAEAEAKAATIAGLRRTLSEIA